MNIKQQILTCLSSTTSGKDFAFSSSSDENRRRFSTSVKDFLKASTYKEIEHRCNELYSTMLDMHDKYPILNPTIERLNVEELYGTHTPEEHRLHYCHQANVFLLGLYIYHNFEPLRNSIEQEIVQTTIKIEREPGYPPFQYSGGNVYGEFLYRWRLASLCHDIGTGIQLCGGNKNKISDSLRRLHFREPINSISQLVSFENLNLLDVLDQTCDFVRISNYMKHQLSTPFPNNVCHDHGIAGSLIFLRLIHEEYSRHRNNLTSRNVDDVEVFWHPDILTHSIAQIAVAIAVHNLEMYPKALEESANELRIFNLKKHPLSWLLKISDLLQEWDKPKADSRNGLLLTSLRLRVSPSEISVENFPQERFDKTVKVLEQYTSPNNIINLVSE